MGAYRGNTALLETGKKVYNSREHLLRGCRKSVFCVLIGLILAFAAFSQNALPTGFFRSASLWTASTHNGRFLSTVLSRRELEIIDKNVLDFAILGNYPLNRSLTFGFSGSVSDDRFFTDHDWNMWLGWHLSRKLTICAAGELIGYSYSPGDAILEDPEDPIASQSQSVLKPSICAGLQFCPAGDLILTTQIENILRPNMAIGDAEESRSAMNVFGGIAWNFRNITPFADIDMIVAENSELQFRGGLSGSWLESKLSLIAGGGNDCAFGGFGYDIGGIILGYGIEMPFGDRANIEGLSHSAFLELREIKIAAPKVEMPDTTDQYCPANPLIAEWLMIRKRPENPNYNIELSCEDLDSAVFYVSPGRKYSMRPIRKNSFWRAEIPDFPGPTCWIAGFKGREGFCLKKIYNNPQYAARMTIVMDEYVLMVPFELSEAVKDTVAAYSDRTIPFYLDSENGADWQLYLDWEGIDRFLFAAPGFEPEPPKIRLASEFAVEKVDNRLHAEVIVSVGRLQHRILATSSWAGDCAVNSDNPRDTLTFIVPHHVPDTIPVIVTGSATDRWWRVHRIGPDTLDNMIIAKVWDNTDYSLFNFIYFAENDRNCIGDIDPHLEHLVGRTVEADGKLLITGYRYKDALCAYNHARKTLPATQVRIDPSLIPPNIYFDPKWPSPDSIWYINNFTQAIVEWEEVRHPEEIAGYMVFADTKPLFRAKGYDQIAHLRLNAEPVVGNMFIISELTPDKPIYVRIAPITGDGRFGQLSNQVEIRTKARRKTTIFEFSSRLGNPSAFDFSEYREVSMRSVNAPHIDMYLGSDATGDGLGNLELKSPSIVFSERTIWKSRQTGILLIDILPLTAPYDVHEVTSIRKKQSEPCRVGGRYLLRTPDGYELLIRVESVEGEFPDRRVDMQYLYRLIETAPIYNWNVLRMP